MTLRIRCMATPFWPFSFAWGACPQLLELSVQVTFRTVVSAEVLNTRKSEVRSVAAGAGIEGAAGRPIAVVRAISGSLGRERGGSPETDRGVAVRAGAAQRTEGCDQEEIK